MGGDISGSRARNYAIIKFNSDVWSLGGRNKLSTYNNIELCLWPTQDFKTKIQFSSRSL